MIEQKYSANVNFLPEKKKYIYIYISEIEIVQKFALV